MGIFELLDRLNDTDAPTGMLVAACLGLGFAAIGGLVAVAVGRPFLAGAFVAMTIGLPANAIVFFSYAITRHVQRRRTQR